MYKPDPHTIYCITVIWY